MNELNKEGFYSMRQAYSDISESDIQEIIDNDAIVLSRMDNYLTIRAGTDRELEAISVIPDPFYARVVNSEGLIQIGDKVYRYFYPYMLEVESPSESQIMELMSLKEGSIPNYATLISLDREVISQNSQSRTTTCSGNTNAKPEYASSPKRRINATLRKVCKYDCSQCMRNIFFYSEVKNQRKSAGIWWPREADEITTNLSGTMSGLPYADPSLGWSFGPPTPNYASYTDYYENKIDFLFAYLITPSCFPYNNSTFDFTGSHSLIDKDGSSSGSTINDFDCI
ncbi:MAG: hypothetical protein AB8H47_18785 [Bacteroidia bacterium]